MACLFDDNPLSEPMMVYCQFGPKEYISMKFCLKFKSIVKENPFDDVFCKNIDHLVSASMY